MQKSDKVTTGDVCAIPTITTNIGVHDTQAPMQRIRTSPALANPCEIIVVLGVSLDRHAGT